mmetsp:Transcript_104633/g.223636  ORF Transcript_104633/g.223636 Transcript_104633/m.223636 type:complete len:300 (-) Transcript_104633:7-906(-)
MASATAIQAEVSNWKSAAPLTFSTSCPLSCSSGTSKSLAVAVLVTITAGVVVVAVVAEADATMLVVVNVGSDQPASSISAAKCVQFTAQGLFATAKCTSVAFVMFIPFPCTAVSTLLKRRAEFCRTAATSVSSGWFGLQPSVPSRSSPLISAGASKARSRHPISHSWQAAATPAGGQGRWLPKERRASRQTSGGNLARQMAASSKSLLPSMRCKSLWHCARKTERPSVSDSAGAEALTKSSSRVVAKAASKQRVARAAGASQRAIIPFKTSQETGLALLAQPSPEHNLICLNPTDDAAT